MKAKICQISAGAAKSLLPGCTTKVVKEVFDNYAIFRLSSLCSSKKVETIGSDLCTFAFHLNETFTVSSDEIIFEASCLVIGMRFVFGPEVEGAHSTFLQFAMDKLRQKKQFDAFSDQKLALKRVSSPDVHHKTSCVPYCRMDSSMFILFESWLP